MILSICVLERMCYTSRHPLQMEGVVAKKKPAKSYKTTIDQLSLETTTLPTWFQERLAAFMDSLIRVASALILGRPTQKPTSPPGRNGRRRRG